MSKMSKNVKTNLICITGFVGEGKTTATNFYTSLGYETFNTDKWVHKIYLKNNEGYKLILKLFGKKYVNDKEVDRKQLKELILSNKNAKYLLEKNVNQLIYKRIKSLAITGKKIFVELGIFLFHPQFFGDLFSKIIVIDGKNKEKNNDFRKFSSIEKFSTKSVGNSNIAGNSGVFYCDFLVENMSDIETLKKNLIQILQIL